MYLRLTVPLPKVVHVPPYWADDPKFNPFYVLKHSAAIARSITRKIRNRTYQPMTPAVQQIPKASGGFREVHIYQIPDAAISNLYFTRLLSKNRHRFSSFAYAYRKDRNVHFAIQDISVDLRYYSRLFIAEFDFSNFFGSIDHGYLFAQFDQNGFFITEDERAIIRSFVRVGGATIGVPQGTSISLFLANLACWRLDKELEKLGVKFARYADDTVIWTSDYIKIGRAYEVLSDFSTMTGVAINFEKSKGISLLTHEQLESDLAPSTHSFDFLGYKLSVGRTSIKDSSVRKIKKQISYLLYKNLIQPLRGAVLRALIIPSNNEDRALLTAISQIRRYLYGNLTEEHLRRYLMGAHGRVNFKGVMSFYPLVDDQQQLQQLDKWLLRTVYRSVRLRARLLSGWGQNRDHQFPFNVPLDRMVPVFRAQRINGKPLLTLPSFLRIHRALRRGLTDSGIEETMNPNSDSYNYD